jgi:hypothetical protein
MNSVLSVVAAALILSSCGVDANSSAPPMSPASDHGVPGGRFRASFSSTVRETIYVDSGKRQPQYGVGARTDVEYSSGSGAPPTVNVSVETLTNIVPPRRARAFLRSFLPSTHGGRIIERQGHLAAIEVVPGCNPSGQCVGDVGTLAVLDGVTLFTVWTAQPSVEAAKAELQTFALPHG